MFLLSAVGSARCAAADDRTLNEASEFSLIAGSFVYHVYAPHDQLTQYLQNRFVALERKLHDKAIDGVVAGTFINSDGNRCLLLGVQKNWRQLSRRATFEGVYAYAGEFLVSAFADCGAAGPYNRVQHATGIGFAPYLYHGIELDLNKHASLEAGMILPGIVVLTIQWHL